VAPLIIQPRMGHTYTPIVQLRPEERMSTRKKNEIAYDSIALIMQMFVEIDTTHTEKDRPLNLCTNVRYSSPRLQSKVTKRTERRTSRGEGMLVGLVAENKVKVDKYEINSTHEPRPTAFAS